MSSQAKKFVQIITPENIPIDLPLALPLDRWSAFFIDVLILTGISILMGCLAYFFYIIFPFPGTVHLIIIFFLLFFFLFWNGYFIYFELKKGTTPGKKRMNFRVVSQSGSFLPASAIYVRNLMREVEVWMPFKILMAMGIMGQEGGAILLSMGWLLFFLVYPFLDPYKRRLGDVLAGTVVIETAQTFLDRDLAKKSAKKREAQGLQYNFTEKMLDVYGKEELQVLEELLRKAPAMEARDQEVLFSSLVEKICRKIGWSEAPPFGQKRLDFLNQFYEAQRQFLENKLLHGKSLERASRRRKFKRER